MNRCLLATGPLLLLSGAAAAQVEMQPRLGQPVRGLTPSLITDWETARDVFNTPIEPEDGLGPAFNDRSCGNCHSGPDVGGSGVRVVTRFGQTGPGGFDPLENLGGSLLQDQAISVTCEEHLPAEANVIAGRLTPICFGSGLLSVVPHAEIYANELNQPPALAGWVNEVDLLETIGVMERVPARFGWKGVIATVDSFSIDASLGEMGLTSVFLPDDLAPNGDQALLAMCDTVPNDPEDVPGADGKTRIDHFTLFQQLLAAPAQTPRSGMTGEILFETVGCADCHLTRTYTTGPATFPQLEGLEIKPYSDFLIHDMGALGDGIVQGPVTETEMLTRAMWGLQARESFLHDGRVSTGVFEDDQLEVIQQHEGEGAASRAAFFALSQTEQDLVIDFLGSLGRIEFDWERDNDVDDFDYFFIQPFMTDPVPSFTPDDEGALGDIDQDGDFDLRDFGRLQRGFTGNL